MEIRRWQVRETLGELRDILSEGYTDPVMVSKGQVSYDDIYLLYDEENGHFKDAPYAHEYQEEPIRPLLELLWKIDRHQLTPRISEEGNRPQNDLIDLTRMQADEKLVKAFHTALKDADLTGNTVQFEIEKENRKVLQNSLDQLCADSHGVRIAMGLWDRYGKEWGLAKPALYDDRKFHWQNDHTLKSMDSEGREIRSGQTGWFSASEMKHPQSLRHPMEQLGSFLNGYDIGEQWKEKTWQVTETQTINTAGKTDQLLITWKGQGSTPREYEATLRKHVEIPPIVLGGISLKELERKMAGINWMETHLVPGKLNPIAVNRACEGWQQAAPIAQDLNKLLEQGAESRPGFILLARKFLLNTPNETVLNNPNELRRTYDKRLRVDITSQPLSLLQAYNLLDGRPVMIKNSKQGVWEGKWVSLHEGWRTADGSLEARPYPFPRGQMIWDLANMGVQSFDKTQVTDLVNGSKTLVRVEREDLAAERVLVIDPMQGGLSFDRSEGEYYKLYRLDDLHLYADRLPKLEQFIASEIERLGDLGIYPAGMDSLRANLLVKQHTRFSCSHSFDKVIAHLTVNIGDGFQHDFHIRTIELDLRKMPITYSSVINNVDINTLEKKMMAVDWKQDYFTEEAADFYTRHRRELGEQWALAYEVSDQLTRLAKDDNIGEQIAASFAVRFLLDTPNAGSDRDRENWQTKISFRPFGAQDFPVRALYNLSYGRYALGIDRPLFEGSLIQSWYRFDAAGYEEGQSATVRVPSDFSVINAMEQAGLRESHMPLLLRAAANGMEAGDPVRVYVDRPKQSIPLIVVADPLQGKLLVDVGLTFLEQGNGKAAQQAMGTRVGLEPMLKAMGKSRSFENGLLKINPTPLTHTQTDEAATQKRAHLKK